MLGEFPEQRGERRPPAPPHESAHVNASTLAVLSVLAVALDDVRTATSTFKHQPEENNVTGDANVPQDGNR